MDELTALRRMDLQWAMHVDRIWHDAKYHVDDVHKEVRKSILDELGDLTAAEEADSPLGLVVTGEAGSGKTHLLSTIRAAALREGAYFVLVDMTDVRDFWETVLLGYLKSLLRGGDDGAPQFHRALSRLPGWSVGVEELRALRPPKLLNVAEKLISGVAAQTGQEMLAHRDVLRALILLASSETRIQAIGFDWLQATGISEDDQLLQGFAKEKPDAGAVVRGLSWLLSLTGPTVLALDQLDAIVAEHNTSTGVDLAALPPGLFARVQESKRIIEGIGRGLLSLRDVTRRTLSLVSCLHATWDILALTSQRAAADRFRSPFNLKPATTSELPRKLVERRLATSYEKLGFQPPYPTWPFRPEAFDKVGGWSPRTLLKRVDQHRRECLAANEAVELGDLTDAGGTRDPAPPPSRATAALDREYDALLRRTDADELLAEARDDELGDLLGGVARLLDAQYPTPESLDLFVEDEFNDHKTYESLHARVRVLDLGANDREQHFSVRVLQRDHPIAFQARLKAALTESGIDGALDFRHLVILRSSDPPKGKATQELLDRLKGRGGRLLRLTVEDVRGLHALEEMRKRELPGWDAWLQHERPLRRIKALAPVTEWLERTLAFGTAPAAEPPPMTNPPSPAVAAPPPPPSPRPATTHPDRGTKLPIGRRVIAGTAGETVSFELGSLTKHLAVLAGAGSGKTVFVRRLIEEAALRRVPGIVVDVANDLSTLGDGWKELPDGFSDDDKRLAEAYGKEVAVRIYTPGKKQGRPLVLAPLPDFASVRDSEDDLEEAIAMAVDSLRPLAISGTGHAAGVQEAILTQALRVFAKQNIQGGLGGFIGLLWELPSDYVTGFENVEKHAKKMSESLRAHTIKDPLFSSEGTPLDPAAFFERPDGKTLVSVLNLAGLGALENQQRFVNQLTMTLFTWVKKHPQRGPGGLGGLFVIDEAKDFVPANRQTACSQSLIRGAAQFRKYGVGMIVATQEPRSVDHKIISNCSSQVIGRANSPAAIATAQELIKQKGGSGDDVSKLGAGQFYAFGEGFKTPMKIQGSWCLTSHPKNPPSADWVIERARR
jgi:hypothetical protein